jgi:hypothetical protein
MNQEILEIFVAQGLGEIEISQILYSYAKYLGNDGNQRKLEKRR